MAEKIIKKDLKRAAMIFKRVRERENLEHEKYF